MSRFADEREAHFVKRLESFVDIVIGFSLAELTLTLGVFPAHPTGIWISFVLTCFAWTFAMTAFLWMLYRRICEDYFVPRPLMVGLHLVGLAGIMLLILGVQAIMHYVSTPGSSDADIGLAQLFYFAALSATLVVCGLQFLVGRALRAGELAPALADRGLGTACRLIAMGLCVALAMPFLPGRGFDASVILIPAMLVGGLVGRLLGIALLKRSGYNAVRRKSASSEVR